MSKRLLQISLLIGIVAMIILLTNWRIQEKFYQYKFDKNNHQKKVVSTSEIDKILATFKQISYQELDQEYKTYTKSDDAEFKKMLLDKTYYQLSRDDFFKFIVNDFRINQFLPKDKYYKACLTNKSKTYHWLIDSTLLKKILELQVALERKGYNKKGFTITNGHRHPRDNNRVGGAKRSRHIKGEAIDIRINDIDNSGKFEQKDKEIVLELLEHEIIKSEGGIGKYPGTRAVHFDVRGYRARWDSF